ncbi:MAG: recombinase family protein [Giesbergeria sp.]|uniref:recombinase family protein n=1 Tax=Giesbergeria sp. TaxID=2818473 RepID=UPI00262A3DD8|nr:recombinase family protein [Giesbergeria sp.]MDD2610776.1 recombinase family protein [Giesbergeria sp.]
MLVGYARVSTEEQRLDLQLDALKGAGCEKVFSDQVSGAAATKAGLDEALAYVRSGDVLVVWKLDRLGRTVKGLVELVDGLKERGVQFKSVTDGIDTSTSAGKFFFHVMAAMAEMERDLIRERTNAGLAAARARGRLGGRKPKMNAAKLDAAKKLLRAGTPVSEVAKTLGVGRATLYRNLNANKQAERVELPQVTEDFLPTRASQHQPSREPL